MKHKLIIVAAMAWIMTNPTLATVVTGRVTDPGDSGVFDVDLDFIDRDTGASIPLVNDDTDVLGFYAVSVPAGDYDVRFKPPAGVRLVAVEERGVRVEGSSMSLDQQLESGWFVSGRVVDSAGSAVSPLDLDVFDRIDANDVFVANDNTDGAGMFTLVLPTGVFDIELEPPIGSLLVPQQVVSVPVTGDTPLGDIVMISGVRLEGTVLGASMTPVGQVLVTTIDPTSGEEIFNIRNTTAADGSFLLVVAPGTLDLMLIPPRGAIELPRYVAGVQLAQDLVLPPLTLTEGILITGHVVDTNAADAEGVDLDFVSTWTRATRFTPRDNTDAGGLFAISIPPGIYDVRFDPPQASGLAPAESNDVSLTVSTVLPTVQLEDGVIVSGAVQNSAGTPQAGLDLDFLDPVGGQEVPSSRDTTDASGGFSATVNSATLDLRVNPMPQSGLADAVVPGVNAVSDVDVGTIVLGTSTSPTVTGLSPLSGSTGGGTSVTIQGSGFTAGTSVRIDSRELLDVAVIGSTTIQGTTPVSPAGSASVVVTNPGAAPVASPLPFSFTAPGSDPVLLVSRTGELGTDLLLEWNDTGRTFYTIFGGAAPNSGSQSIVDATGALSYRVEGGATGAPSALSYFTVH